MLPGEVIHIDEKYLEDIDHGKFAVCVCEQNHYYFYINSKAYPFLPPESQVRILGSLELPFLTHECWVDTSKLHCFDPKVVGNASSRGEVPQSIKKRIVAAVNASEALPREQIEIVLNKFK